MPTVVLVGAPGSGKSTTGRLVAELLGEVFRDSDELVETTTGLGVSDIFVLYGEAHFRQLERDAVLAGLADQDGVLALGGGAVASEQVRAALVGRAVVWLDVSDVEAVRRVGLSAPRPVLLGNLRGQWAQLMQQRAPWYEQVARWRIDTTGRDPAEVADHIRNLLRGA